MYRKFRFRPRMRRRLLPRIWVRRQIVGVYRCARGDYVQVRQLLGFLPCLRNPDLRFLEDPCRDLACASARLVRWESVDFVLYPRSCYSRVFGVWRYDMCLFFGLLLFLLFVLILYELGHKLFYPVVDFACFMFFPLKPRVSEGRF